MLSTDLNIYDLQGVWRPEQRNLNYRPTTAAWVSRLKTSNWEMQPLINLREKNRDWRERGTPEPICGFRETAPSNSKWEQSGSVPHLHLSHSAEAGEPGEMGWKAHWEAGGHDYEESTALISLCKTGVKQALAAEGVGILLQGACIQP